MSSRALTYRREQWPIRGGFRISRGEKFQAEIIVVEIADGVHAGRGECVPYLRYGKTYETVAAEIDAISDPIGEGMTRADVQNAMKPGAARNAVDCALIDLEAKISRTSAHELLGLPPPEPLKTAYTLCADDPAAMGLAAAEAVKRGHGFFKLKVTGAEDIERVRAVRAEAPRAELIVDANEAWSSEVLKRLAPELEGLGVVLIEQPLEAKSDEILQDFVSAVPLCADESCHTRADLARLEGRYQYINIKLDKTGGLTEALALARAAREMGFEIMLGCMVATSLAMAPSMLLGGLAAYVDLDGPLLLERDREPGLNYEGEMVYPPKPALWG